MINKNTLLCLIILFSSSLFSFDSSLISKPLNFYDSDDEILITTKKYDVVARLREKNFQFFSVYTLIGEDFSSIIYAKVHFYSNATVVEMYDSENSPLGVITEVHSQPVIFQKSNPISYEIFDSTYATIGYGKRNLFNTKFRIFDTYPDLKKPSKIPSYYIKRSKLAVDPIKWRVRSAKKYSSLPPEVLLFLCAYQLHAEKRFELIENNKNLVPFNPFFDIAVFSEDPIEPEVENVLDN